MGESAILRVLCVVVGFVARRGELVPSEFEFCCQGRLVCDQTCVEKSVPGQRIASSTAP